MTPEIIRGILLRNPDPSTEILPGTYKGAWVQYENGSLTLDGCFSLEEVKALVKLVEGPKEHSPEVRPLVELVEASNEHNPHNLTPEQYGKAKGYRLLDKDEVGEDFGLSVVGLESYTPLGALAWRYPAYGHDISISYRTKLTREQLRAARGL